MTQDDTDDVDDTDTETGTDNEREAEAGTETDAEAEDAAGDASTEDTSSGGLASVLRDLIETVAQSDFDIQGNAAVSRGRTDIGRMSVGHDVSIGVGTVDDAVADAGETAPASEGPDHPTSVEYDDGGTEALVAIDVPEIEPEALAAGVSSRNGDLLVGDGERIIERVSHRLADASLAAASYHNGILEVHLREGGNRS